MSSRVQQHLLGSVVLVALLAFLAFAGTACGTQTDTGNSNDAGENPSAEGTPDEGPDSAETPTQNPPVEAEMEAADPIETTTEETTAEVPASAERQAAEAQYADGGGAPAEQYDEALDQLPEAPAAMTEATSGTINTLESLEGFLEDIALQEVNPFWAQTFAGLQQAQQNERTQQYGDQYAPTSEVDYYYESADLMILYEPTETACGVISSDTGSAYCPPERTVYFAMSSELEDAEKYGPFSFAFTIAHEWGHHVQNELGYSNLRDESNDVAFENQADCFAGVWARSYYTRGHLNDIDILGGIEATYGFGDTRLEEGGKDHGSPTERVQWFLTGYNTGNPSACRTFTP